MSNPVRLTIGAFILFLALGTMNSFGQCKEINAVATVIKTTNDTGKNQSIKVEFKDGNSQHLQLNFFGTSKNNILRTDKNEFNNLSTGKYLIVIVGKREEDNYCTKSINITID
jgi:hypothetical protein